VNTYEENYGWQTKGRCADATPEVRDAFFDPHSPLRQTAYRLCSNCPVKNECLEHAIAHETMGIWGGVSSWHFKRIRNERGIRIDTPQTPLMRELFNGARSDTLRKRASRARQRARAEEEEGTA